MAVIFKLSDAVAIGLHAAMFLALHEGACVKARTIAVTFDVSEAHLVKVLQALHRAGLIAATRGPGGGYRLARPAKEIPLTALVEAIEGPIEIRDCLLHHPVCADRRCILGPLVREVNHRTLSYLQGHTAHDLAEAFRQGQSSEPPASTPSTQEEDHVLLSM